MGHSPVLSVGFDPGITSPGVAVIRQDSTGTEVLCAVTVRTNASEPDTERYRRIFDMLHSMLTRFGRCPDVLCVEDVRRAQVGAWSKERAFNADSSKVTIATGLAFAIGFSRPTMQVLTLAPQTARRIAMGAGSGNADDERVKRFLDMSTRGMPARTSKDARAAVLLAKAGALVHREQVRKNQAACGVPA